MNVLDWVRTPFRQLQRSAGGHEPANSLFSAIRWRLTLWYSVALAILLLGSSVALYITMRGSLLGPIDRGLQQRAQALSQSWQEAATRFPDAANACAGDRFAPQDWLLVCYDTHGHVMGESRLLMQEDTDIANPSLAAAAFRDGSGSDMQDSGGLLGTVERYAVRVPAPAGGYLGVIQVATPIGVQLDSLQTLLRRLLLLGVLTIVLAAIAGLLLANRALLPARMAHARQQEFIADASHELRTPLTILRSNVEVILRGRRSLPPDDVLLLEDTVKEAAHLTNLANSMLDLARLDGADAHLEREVIDLVQLAYEVARWAGPLGAEHGLQIGAEGSGSVLVLGDRTLLEQAIISLIDNAIKYNRPGGSISVRAWKDDQAHVEVRDSGIGIESVHLARLGERFYRVDKARSRDSGGAGLGLSIVRGIVLRHEGDFTVTSERGVGTAATLSLPLARLRSDEPVAI